MFRDYRSHLTNYFEVASIGAMDPSGIGRWELETFVTWLVSHVGEYGQGLWEKSAANVVRGTLRAYLPDRGYSLAPLDALRWEPYAP